MQPAKQAVASRTQSVQVCVANSAAIAAHALGAQPCGWHYEDKQLIQYSGNLYISMVVDIVYQFLSVSMGRQRCRRSENKKLKLVPHLENQTYRVSAKKQFQLGIRQPSKMFAVIRKHCLQTLYRGTHGNGNCLLPVVNSYRTKSDLSGICGTCTIYLDRCDTEMSYREVGKPALYCLQLATGERHVNTGTVLNLILTQTMATPGFLRYLFLIASNDQ